MTAPLAPLQSALLPQQRPGCQSVAVEHDLSLRTSAGIPAYVPPQSSVAWAASLLPRSVSPCKHIFN